MPRIIKFRVWNIEKKELLYPTESLFPGSQNLGPLTRYNKDIIGDTNNIVLEQFTGLKDKNGIDIYEGDMIEVTISKEYLNEGVFEAEVKYDTTSGRFYLDNDFGSLTLWTHPSKASYFPSLDDGYIRGNIFEDKNKK